MAATLGVILPSFVIILLIAAIINNLLKFAGVQAALDGIRPAITALIFATAITMILNVIFGITKAGNAVQRSRCRRIIREAFRMQPPVTGGYDIVFVARGRTAECKSTRIAAVMERQLRALGVLAP